MHPKRQSIWRQNHGCQPAGQPANGHTGQRTIAFPQIIPIILSNDANINRRAGHPNRLSLEVYMKEKRNLHQKVQEMCNCYATTDPLKSMSQMANEDSEDAAVKWLALAALHGVNANAKKITIYQAGDQSVRVVAEYRPTDLPAPSKAIAEKVMAAVREITHIEGEKGKLPLSLGIRDSSIDIQVKIKSEGGENKISLKFGE
jgi:GGDEF domain-containing protein